VAVDTVAEVAVVVCYMNAYYKIDFLSKEDMLPRFQMQEQLCYAFLSDCLHHKILSKIPMNSIR
jgi:hypothetical protein